MSETLEEVHFDLELLQQRCQQARDTLLSTSKEASLLAVRLKGLRLHAAKDLRKDAEGLARCCSAADAIMAGAPRSGPRPAQLPDRAPDQSASRPQATRSNSASASSATRCAGTELPAGSDAEVSSVPSAAAAVDADDSAASRTPWFDTGRLRLTRPLCTFDLETTGLSTRNDRVVEFAGVRLQPDGSATTLRLLLDPEVPIPRAAEETHRITDAHVRGQPRFEQVAGRVWRFFQGADICGYNCARFDVPLLAAEFARCGDGVGDGVGGGTGGGSGGGTDARGSGASTESAMSFPQPDAHVIDALVVFKRCHNFKLASAHRMFCGTDMQNAHTALADAEATLKVLLGQLRFYPGLGATVPALHELCLAPPKVKYMDRQKRFQWLDGQAAFAFGKYKGFSLAQAAAVDAKYVDWLANRDFGEEAARIIADARRGVFTLPPEPA